MEEAKKELHAVYLPPAAMGDVYRAGLEKPEVIAIIDGVFEQTPAVTHKEILWAMSEGIHVLGAASMGALRAEAKLQWVRTVCAGDIRRHLADHLRSTGQYAALVQRREGLAEAG